VLRVGSGALETEQAERFLAAGVRSFSLLGVPARSVVRSGDPLEEIQREAGLAKDDLLVVGAPLAGRRGRIALAGIVENIVKKAGDRAVLITRSHQTLT